MFFFRSFSHVVALLSAVAIATPIRDLTTDPIQESHCEWPDLQVDDELDGVMVLHRGRKLAEWRNPDSQDQDWWGYNWQQGTTQHALFSVTKTWVSVLIGMLYRDGYLDWTTEHPDTITLGDIFSDEDVWDDVLDIPYLIHGGSRVPELKAITLGELMSMRTGYFETGFFNPFDTSLVQDLDGLVAWWHLFYRRGDIDSQTCFECGKYLASAGIVNYIILEKTKTSANPRGWDPLDYARQTSSTLPNGNVGLFEALGMEDGSYSWDRDSEGVARGAFGLWTDLEDMAKFGQLLLQDGQAVVNGVLKEVVPYAYLEEMTTTQSRMDGSNLPMGWQVWTWGEDDDGESGFCAEGLGWQSICVFPKHETVVAIQASASWYWESGLANIEFRNEAIRRIRDGIDCSPTSAPAQPGFVTPTSAPTRIASAPQPEIGFETPTPTTSPTDSDSEANDSTLVGVGSGSGNGDESIQAESNQSNLSTKKEAGSSNNRAGVIFALVLACIIIAVLGVLLCCARRRLRKQKKARAIDVPCKVIPAGSVYNGEKKDEVYDVDLGEDEIYDDDMSKGSLETADSDGVTYYVEAEEVTHKSSADFHSARSK